MATITKLVQGTPEWFAMLGELMCEAASRAALPADLNLSVVERYTDGAKLPNGLFQGVRFTIEAGKPVFRAGVSKDETADIVIEVTADAARQLNLLYSADPRYMEALGAFINSGEMRIEGDPTRLGDWLSAIHDPIVDRTC